MGFECIDQPGWSSEVEHDPKSSILFFRLERDGRWGSSPLTSLADHQKLNVIQKWAFYFLAAEGWQMGFESIIQPSRSSEVDHNPKMSILYFWLERGDRWGSSPSTSPADHQKLNVIQKWAFHIFGWRGVTDRVQVHWPARLIIRSWMKSKNEHLFFWQMGFECIDQPGQSSEVEHSPKMSISFFFAGEGWQTGFESIDQTGRSSEVECNPKMSILYFWLERGSGWGSSPLTSPSDHQKLNVIQKWAFYIFGCRGVAEGVWVHQPARPIIRSWT